MLYYIYYMYLFVLYISEKKVFVYFVIKYDAILTNSYSILY